MDRECVPSQVKPGQLPWDTRWSLAEISALAIGLSKCHLTCHGQSNLLKHYQDWNSYHDEVIPRTGTESLLPCYLSQVTSQIGGLIRVFLNILEKNKTRLYCCEANHCLRDNSQTSVKMAGAKLELLPLLWKQWECSSWSYWTWDLWI